MMIKQTTSVSILFFLLSGNAFAEFSVYTIDNKFEAAFPAVPELTGETGEGKNKHRSYNYTDEKNLIIYTATYQVGKLVFKKSDISEALNYYVKGQAISVGGSVESYSNKNINGNDSAIFYVKLQYHGMPVRKYGVVSYKDGHFYQWAVQDIPTISSLNAKNIFNTYLDNFSVN